MADKGYNSDFRLMLRYDGGLRVVTNGLSIRILELLIHGDMNLTEVSRSLGSPKTTVQANLCRLEEDGMLTTYPDEDDSRSVIYCINCTPIYTSHHSQNPGRGSYLSAVSDPTAYGKDPHGEAMMIYATKMAEYGICITPMLIDIGGCIGTHISDRVTDMTSIGKALNRIFDVGISEIRLEEEVSFRVESGSMPPMIIEFTGYIIFGALMRILSGNGTRVDLDPEVRSLGDRGFLFGSSVVSKVPSGKYMAGSDRRDCRFYRLDDRFAIYGSQGRDPLVLQNDIMLDIMHAMESGPLTANDVSSSCGIKPVTVHASIKKLVDIGLLEPMGQSEMRNVRYRPTMRNVLRGETSDAICSEFTVDDHLEKFLSKDISLFRLIYDTQYFMLTSAGISYNNIMDGIGSELGRTMVSNNPGIKAEDFLRMAAELPFYPGCVVRLVSFIPVEFTVFKNGDLQNFEGFRNLFTALTETGLEEITGMHYPVKVTRL